MKRKLYIVPRMIFECNFSGFKEPEMVKTERPVIVISSKEQNKRGLCTIVCVSTSAPNPVEEHHHRLKEDYQLRAFTADSWVKCDMVYRVSHDRLTSPLLHTGARHTKKVSIKEYNEIMKCVLSTLTLESIPT